jgi:branched-chain amino acid transport system ATP-binding protein
MSDKPSLSLRGITASYGSSQVLFGVDLDVPSGTTVALLGRNGAGKSTTFKSIAGVLKPSAGKILYGSRQLNGLPTYEISRAGIAFVPEDRQVFPELTVLENLEIGQKAGASGRKEWTVGRVLEVFPILANMQTRKGGRLSGGEQQMLTIARSLMGNPDVILLDEPSEGLAPIIVAQIIDLIRLLRTSGVTIVLAEQNMHVCVAVADHIAIIEKGLIVYTGTTADFKANDAVRKQYLEV